jgi:hypothetical protein
MQQSLFAQGGISAADPIGLWQNFEARWRTAIVVALGLAATALIAALAAVGLTLLR